MLQTNIYRESFHSGEPSRQEDVQVANALNKNQDDKGMNLAHGNLRIQGTDGSKENLCDQETDPSKKNQDDQAKDTANESQSFKETTSDPCEEGDEYAELSQLWPLDTYQ